METNSKSGAAPGTREETPTLDAFLGTVSARDQFPINMTETRLLLERFSDWLKLHRSALITQIIVHCELLCSGVRLAAQVGCNADDLPAAIDVITAQGCLFVVEENTEQRVGIWIYKSPSARILIDSLRDMPPSRFREIVTGKLFGYSDAEIEKFGVAVHLSEAQADLTYWKRNALALTTLLKASTPDTQWPGIEKAFGELLDKLKADSAEAQAEVERLRKELASLKMGSAVPTLAERGFEIENVNDGKCVTHVWRNRRAERSEASEKAMREALRRVNEEAIALLQTGMGTEHFVAYGETCLTIKQISESALAAAQANHKGEVND